MIGDERSGDIRRQAGIPQGVTFSLMSLLPVFVILALPSALPSMIEAFRGTPHAETIISSLIGIPGLVVALLASPVGWIIDRYGRRGPIIGATILYVVGGLVPVVFPTLGWILFSRILIGISQTVLLVGSAALLADYFAVDQRRTWLTVQGIFMAVAAPAAALLSGVLAGYGWQYPFLIYGFGLIVLLPIILFLFEPNRTVAAATDMEATKQGGQAFPWDVAALVVGITFVASILFSVFVFHSGLVFRAVGVMSPERIGAMLGIATLGAPAGTILFNLASRRLSSEQLLSLMLLVLGLGLLGVGLSRELGLTLTAALVHQMGGGLAIPALVFWISQVFPPEHRARGFGLHTATFFFGQFICAPLLWLTEGVAGGMLPAMAALGGVGIAIALLLFAFSRRPQQVAFAQ